jgi:hypothetical protein
MLDVHPPEHTPHSWRDFLIHIATIVVGLVIAVGIEQTVEWIHHRVEVAAARRELALEEKKNVKIFHEDAGYLDSTQQQVRAYIVVLQHSLATKTPPTRGLNIDPQLEDFVDTAFKAADRTGTLALMPQDEAAPIADRYLNFTQMEGRINDMFFKLDRAQAIFLADPDPSHLTVEQEQHLYSELSEVLGDLNSLHATIQGFAVWFPEYK